MSGQRSVALWTAIGGVCAVVSTALAVVQFTRDDDPPDRPVQTGAVVPGTTAAPVPVTEAPPDTEPPPAPAALDLSLAPVFGSGDAAAGFAGDPLHYPMTAGGPADIATIDRDGCRGYSTPAPSFQFHWEGTGGRLKIFFVGDGDTTLAINDGTGAWQCNDDWAGGRNPLVELASAPSGPYDIYVGTFAAGLAIPGTLYFTELEGVTPDTV